MDKLKYIWLIVIIIFIFLLVFGPPDEITIWGVKWCIKNCNEKITTVSPEKEEEPKKLITPIDLLSIEGLKPRQQIYMVGENATVDFTIKDDKEIPYYFNVYWFYNETGYHGWYNKSNTTKPFYSWYPLHKKGEWKVQVVLSWEYFNKTYSKDSIAYVEAS